MAHIAIDVRFASSPTGLGRYARELTAALLRQPLPFQVTLIADPKDALHWVPSTPGLKIARLAARPYSLSEQWKLPQLLKEIHCNLYYNLHFPLPLRLPVPGMCTVHDVTLHKYPNSVSLLRRIAYRFLFGSSVRRAKKIICVSESVLGELVGMYPKARSSAVFVDEGIDPLFAPQDQSHRDALCAQYGISKPYFLYVGNAKEHKNVPLLLKAFEESGRNDAELVLVSGGPELAQLKLPERVRVVTNVQDAELAALYSGALALVTATLAEGFCLPVPEAFACGCPVIASDIPALQRWSPPAKLLPNAVSSFAQAMSACTGARIAPPVNLPRWSDAAEKIVSLLADF